MRWWYDGRRVIFLFVVLWTIIILSRLLFINSKQEGRYVLRTNLCHINIQNDTNLIGGKCNLHSPAIISVPNFM